MGIRVGPARAVAMAGVLGMVMVTAGCDPEPSAWTRALVSAGPDGTSEGDGDTDRRAVFSADGSAIAFSSEAGNLDPLDTDADSDVFVRDLEAGTTTLVSVDAGGTGSGAGPSHVAAISPDGTKVLFTSAANDLVAGDLGGQDVFLRDLAAGTTTLVSTHPSWEGQEHGDSGFGGVSADWTKVAFYNTNTPFPPPWRDVWLRDLSAGTTTLVTENADGTGGADDNSENVSLSPDGTKVVFESSARNLVPGGDTDPWDDVFLRDMTTGTTIEVSAGPDPYAYSHQPVLSPDGRTIAFNSNGTDIWADDEQGWDIFLYDIPTGEMSLLSLPGFTSTSGFDNSAHPSFSADGRKVAFTSYVDGPPADENAAEDAYVRDLDTGEVTLVSAGPDGHSGTGAAIPVIDPAGTRVAFIGFGDDYGTADHNGAADLYVRDLVRGHTSLVSAAPGGTDGSGYSSRSPVFRPGSADIAFADFHGDVPFDSWDLYLATIRGADLGTGLSVEPGAPSSGAAVTLTAEVGNGGPDAAGDVTAGVVVPEGVTVTGTSAGQGTCPVPAPGPATVVACDLGDVGAGDTTSITVSATVTAAPGTELTFLAVAHSPTVDPVPGDGTHAVTVTVG